MTLPTRRPHTVAAPAAGLIGAALAALLPCAGTAPAAAAAAATATTAKSPTAAATAATATAAVFTTRSAAAAAAAATARRTVFARTSNVNGQGTTAELGAIQCVNGLLSFRRGAHGDETEAARTTRGAIHHQVGFGDGAVGGKRVLEFILRGVEGKIPDEQFVTHVILLS
jgi:hypothetical protein